MRNFCLTITLLIATAGSIIAGPTEDFATANKSFIDDDFKQAYSGYQSLLDEGHINSDLLYNIGNASYRLDRIGEAVLWYERALVLDPTHREARQNLSFLIRSTGILQFDQTELGFGLNNFRRNTLVRIATFAGWLAVLGIAAALTLRLGNGTKTCLWIATPLLAVIALAAACGIYLKHRSSQDLGTRAIVTVADSKALTAPARAADPVIQLPPGTQLKQLSKRGSWDYVDIPNDLRGWVPEASIKPLWPYDPGLAD